MMSPKVMLATPCYGGMTHTAYTHSALETCAYLAKHGVPALIDFQPGDSLVPRARNVQVARFIASDCTHLLFVDSDQRWEFEAIGRMVDNSSRYEELAVVCAAVPRKAFPISFVANFKADDKGELIVHDPTQYIELRDAGTGILLIRRDAIERLIIAYPQRKCYFRNERDAASAFEYLLFDCFIDRDLTYLSEDYGFSRLWQSIGGRVWLDPDVEVSHFGYHEYRGRILDSLTGATKEKESSLCQPA